MKRLCKWDIYDPLVTKGLSKVEVGANKKTNFLDLIFYLIEIQKIFRRETAYIYQTKLCFIWKTFCKTDD